MNAELRALSWRISIHALEYSLTISPLYGSPPWSISIVLVGNQIADSERPIDYGFASTGQYRTARSGALVTVGSPGWPRAVIIGNGSPGR
jgi:hypothetical protein